MRELIVHVGRDFDCRLWLLLALLLSLAHAVAADEHGLRLGKAVYKKANCVGCHKWHGGGGGGYGGVALSLRETQLDRDWLITLVRCGRPGTRMPYHDRKAYTGDSRDCYQTPAAEFGDTLPPKAPKTLRDKEINAVVDYVQAKIQGRGPPGYEDCADFWGADATRCRRMQETASAQY